MKIEWKNILYDTWVNCREYPGWADIYDLHDKEDQEFFIELESWLDGCSK